MKFMPLLNYLNSGCLACKMYYNIIQYVLNVGSIMGNFLSQQQGNRPTLQRSSSSTSTLTLSSTQSMQVSESDTSAKRKWRASSKSFQDLVQFIQSEQSQEENYETALLYIATLTNRDKLIETLQQLEKYLLGTHQTEYCRKLRESDVAYLLQQVHTKFGNIWFIYLQLDPSSTSPWSSSMINNRLSAVPEHSASPQHYYNSKLAQLYYQLTSTSSISLAEYEQLLKMAALTNYPNLFTHQTIQYVFTKIVEEDIYIEDTISFMRFWRTLIQVMIENSQEMSEYNERVQAKLKNNLSRMAESEKEQIANYMKLEHCREISQESSAIGIVIDASCKIFMNVGYSNASELIFHCINEIQIKNKAVWRADHLNIYLFIRIYSIFIYDLNYVNLKFDTELRQMTIVNVIHLMLSENDLSVLAKLKAVYADIAKMPASDPHPSFNHELSDYIFSNYCTLKLCLEVINQTDYVPRSEAIQRKLVQKLKKSKFDVILDNQAAIIKYFEGNEGEESAKNRCDIEEVIDVLKLMSLFGVNEKFENLWIFYEEPSRQEKSKRDLELQEKAIYLLKLFISKYFICDKSKKVTLNNKAKTPTVLEVSKPDTIFSICQFLYDKVFYKGISDVKNIHQIIFQHMLYFYRYEDARVIITSESIIKKFNIRTEMLEILVIENIAEELKKQSIKAVGPDINTQLKMLKGSSIEIQAVKSMFRLFSYLEENGIQLESKEKQKINIGLMYTLLNRYENRIEGLNFDEIYENIKEINADHLIEEDEAYMMTNELLVFKSKLAAKAYHLGKKKLGNELIDEISRFNPPWLTTELIEIFKDSSYKLDKRIYGIAVKSCAKGDDLEYLISLWKQQKEQNLKQSKGKKLGQYFETGREYLIIDDSLVKNEEEYRNYVAECQFGDEQLRSKKYELFFILLGSEPKRAFHHALRSGLSHIKLQIFFREGMKINLFQPYKVAEQFHKMMYLTLQSLYNDNKAPLFAQYAARTITEPQIKQQLEISKQKSNLVDDMYVKSANSYLCSLYITPKFITTYFSASLEPSVVYEILFNQKNRKSLLISLREEPMGRSDIFTLGKVCSEILDVDLLQLCLFSLCNTANTAKELSEKGENNLQKIITLTTDNEELCSSIVEKLIDRIFKVAMLTSILKYMKMRENIIYQQLINDRQLQVLSSLGTVQIGQQFHGLIPSSYFREKLKYNPQWPISEKHNKIIKKVGSKTNIFVLSKVLYFFYGMNPNVEKAILDQFLKQVPNDEEFQQLRQKLRQIE